MGNIGFVGASALLFISMTVAAQPRGDLPIVRHLYRLAQISQITYDLIQQKKNELAALKALPPASRNFKNTVGRLENIFADFNYQIQRVIFMGSVHTDPDIRKEASDAEADVSKFMAETFADPDLFEVIKDQKPGSADQKALFESMTSGFESSGATLADRSTREKFLELNKKLIELETGYEQNLLKKGQAQFTPAELEGLPQDFFERKKKDGQIDAQGSVTVTTDEPDFRPLMQFAKNPKTRERMYRTYYTRQSETNTRLIQEAVEVRLQMAKLMGFPSWAAYKTKNQMAKTAETVNSFLGDLRDKLKDLGAQEMQDLLKIKQELEPGATVVDIWDKDYLLVQYEARKFNFDREKVREYFPIERVRTGIFEVYSELLGVRFEEVKNVDTWAPGVKLYAVHDAKSGKLLSHFYTDLRPRDGKYKHFAAFPLVEGRKTRAGYRKPTSALVGNFDERLSLEEVETFFHEFGHIMHGVLTQARYASLAGTNTMRDFVEAPSQMLESWIHNLEIIRKISGHYLNPDEKLPEELFKQAEAASEYGRGTLWLRQVSLALFDMGIHGENAPKDITAFFHELSETVTGFPRVLGTFFPAVFGHMMGGYTAGYYGYLWSKAYAADMFTRFRNEGLLNALTGGDYRKIILERGGMEDALVLVQKFLKRNFTLDSLFEALGTKKKNPSPGFCDAGMLMGQTAISAN